MAFKRNSECWCGSKKKYKSCHFEFDQKMVELKMQGKMTPDKKLIKNEKDIQCIKESAKINTLVLDAVAEKIKAGMSTAEIDQIVYDTTIAHHAIPAPLNYEGFPKSVCTSINHEVCHGIPDEKVILKEGDIVNVDVSTIYNGYYSDASRMFMIGEVSDDARRIVETCEKAVEAGLAAIKPWGYLGDVSHAIQTYAEARGYQIVRALGGHGIGKEFHEDPFVAHYGEEGTGMILAPGMVFTIEPMLNEGTYDVYVDEKNGWTIYTADHKLSAQWENMVLITEDGYEILTK